MFSPLFYWWNMIACVTCKIWYASLFRFWRLSEQKSQSIWKRTISIRRAKLRGPLDLVKFMKLLSSKINYKTWSAVLFSIVGTMEEKKEELKKIVIGNHSDQEVSRTEKLLLIWIVSILLLSRKVKQINDYWRLMLQNESLTMLIRSQSRTRTATVKNDASPSY